MTEVVNPDNSLIIQGITKDGRKFRPSDWAERMSGMLSTFGKDHRILYSPQLKPLSYGGNKCIVIDRALEASHPGVYHQIIDFAKRNDLVIVNGQGKEVEI